MKASILERFPILRDIVNLLFFVFLVVIGTIIINNFIFRTYSVQGPSMENTLFTNDRLIVNRIPVTIAHLQNKEYVPERCQVIVFKNPKFASMQRDENIVKRVIAFAGEKIRLSGGKYTVFNDQYPQGFNPDDCANSEPKSPTAGDVSDYTVPEGEIFVSGDNRFGSYSYDSRNGLGTIPLYDVIGPVSMRIFPFDKLRLF